jgi:hypothetical protein
MRYLRPALSAIMQKSLRKILPLASVIAIAIPLHASITGTISGTVSDPQGAVMPGVRPRSTTVFATRSRRHGTTRRTSLRPSSPGNNPWYFPAIKGY